MSAARVLLHGARLSVFQLRAATEIDIKGWVANQNYFVDIDLKKDEFTLRASNPEEVKSALANDLNRMVSASFECAAGISSDVALPRSLAWGAIRSYYASFFAAHALMRLYGTAVSLLDSAHVKAIHASAVTFGKAGGLTGLEAGVYSIEIDPSFTSVRFQKLKDSHKDTWAVFLSLLKALQASVPSSTALSKSKVEASGVLTELKDGITKTNSTYGNWLSTTRNSINYRLTHGVWFPYASRDARIELLDAASRNWLNAPSSIKTHSFRSELDYFFGIGCLMVSTVRELVTTAAQLSAPLNPAFRNGCLKLLNDVQASRTARQSGAAST